MRFVRFACLAALLALLAGSAFADTTAPAAASPLAIPTIDYSPMVSTVVAAGPGVATEPSVVLAENSEYRGYRRRPDDDDPYRNDATSPLAGYYGGYGSYVTEPDAPSASPTPPGRAVVGFLRVSGTPAEAQVFVDGYFVGTLGDIEAGRPLMIDAGPHRLELRAPGYQSTSVDIRLAPNDTLTYRAALERVQPAAPPRTGASAAAASTMYLIPNCFLGNVPPRANRLSPGCDIKQVQVLGAK